MLAQEFRHFSSEEQNTWTILFNKLSNCRKEMAHPIFERGIAKLELSGDHFPDLDAINKRLIELTGWRGIPVEGLESNESFFTGMRDRLFPIGNFIRDAEDVNYTPAPDIFHDLYGHLPFLADPDFADFCQEFGERASQYLDHPTAMEQFGRLFWFGVEFPVVATPQGNRIFGGGILSSYGESVYALSDEPNLIPFDIELIRQKDYKIDEFQKDLFLLESPQQLYGCLGAFEQAVKKSLH